MTPGARAAAAIEVLDRWLNGAGRAERLLRDWGRANRFAGSKDRRAIQDIVYACLRRRRSFGTSNGAKGGRGLVIGHCLHTGADVAEIFSGAGYAPPALTDAERTGAGDRADAVLFDHPDWLEAPLKSALGQDYAPVMTALQDRAPIDLRANLLKCSREQARATLAVDGIETTALDLAPTALRAAPGARVLSSDAFNEGLVEIQDAASQAAVTLCGVQPGMDVLDYCAGGGGKTLALAGALQNRGRLVAHDIAADRMKDLPARAGRAGASVDICQHAHTLTGGFDLVFVDAPCSGSGTWRREPEAKWALTPARLRELVRQQGQAFDSAVPHVRPGGLIAYATCSILTAENQDQADALMARYPGLTPVRALRLLPGEASDGFFVSLFRKA